MTFHVSVALCCLIAGLAGCDQPQFQEKSEIRVERSPKSSRHMDPLAELKQAVVSLESKVPEPASGRAMKQGMRALAMERGTPCLT